MNESEGCTLAYFVFGERDEYQLELSLSVLSAVRFLRADPAEIRVVVVTEEGRTRPDLPIEHLHFSEPEFNLWRGTAGNVHRVKEFALLKVLDRYRGRVAHIDPDTYFLAHPKRLFDRIDVGRTVMHENEGRIGSHVIWNPMLRNGPQEFDGIRVEADSPMYNSGVIGIHFDDRALLHRAVSIEDRLYTQLPIFNIEQFCTGAVLAHHTQLTECKDLIRHYWGPERRFINLQSKRLFASRTKDEFEALARLREFPHVGYPVISFGARLKARLLRGPVRRDEDYRFAYIAYLSAREWAFRDRELANAWLEVSCDSLTWILSTDRWDARLLNKFIQRDFAQCFDTAEAWINKDTAARFSALL